MTRPRAHIHLPPLSPREALIAVGILERAIAAIWRAHGDRMADELALLGADTPRPRTAQWAGDPDADPDDDC